MRKSIETLKNIWKIEDLRQRILITILFVAIYRFGSYVVLPGINPAMLTQLHKQTSEGLLALLNMFSGGAFSNASIFALGIMPYISASIVIQLLAIAVPYFQKIQREGESGRRKINQYTRILTIAILVFQAPSYLLNLKMQAGPSLNASLDWTFFIITSTIILAAGSMFILWLGERITDKGIGNGISFIILIGIIAGYILAIVLGMVDFTQVQTASWIALPTFMPVKMEFNLEVIIAMGIMFIATTVETVGDVSGITNGGLDREATSEELQGGVLADGLGSVVASLFGVLPNTSFSQNVGLVSVTKVVNRFTIMTGAIFLILCGFCPKLSALFAVMPQSVLGGAAVIMFASILVSGIQSLMRVEFNERNTLIIALAIGLGIGIGQVPTVLAQLPSWVGNIFAQNGIIMTFVIATVLNLILPGKKD